MLTELRVANLGIIAELCVSFTNGLTAITGETGAGKTLLVDALELLCGGRADAAMVRDGADEARVEGRFVADNEEHVIARVLPREGRSRGYINGRLATASELAELGRLLVDLHGQHAHQSLLAPAEQRALLDRYAGDEALVALEQVRTSRAYERGLERELAAMGGDERSRSREVDLLRYQIAEIESAEIVDDDEGVRLAREEAVLADAEAHRESLDRAYRALEGAAADALGDAVGALVGREPFTDLANQVRALQSEVIATAHDVRVTAESVVADPDRLAAIHERRAQLRELARKYGPELRDVIAYATEVTERLAQLEQHDARAAALEREVHETRDRAAAAAKGLSRIRRAAAGPLAAEVTDHLRELAMPAAMFTVELHDADLTDDGADDVLFMLAPNPGEASRPLARAASGGELARTMLALRVVLSEAPPTLIFDEVDAGIGGEAGTAVGRKLATLGAQHQVLCVTHLAQVAAFADAHLAVTKREIRGRTVAEAALLLDDARVAEISRMLAGDEDSAHARRHAQELVERSARSRAASRPRSRR
jgi:DNA repair protein RecN (Recombination protein N)